MAKGVLLAFTSPTSPDQEAEFNDWYDNTHIAEVKSAVPQITEVSRYRLVDPENPGADPRYLCVYDIVADDVMEAAAALGAAGPTLTQTATMDLAKNPPVLQWFQGA